MSSHTFPRCTSHANHHLCIRYAPSSLRERRLYRRRVHTRRIMMAVVASKVRCLWPHPPTTSLLSSQPHTAPPAHSQLAVASLSVVPLGGATPQQMKHEVMHAADARRESKQPLLASVARHVEIVQARRRHEVLISEASPAIGAPGADLIQRRCVPAQSRGPLHPASFTPPPSHRLLASSSPPPHVTARAAGGSYGRLARRSNGCVHFTPTLHSSASGPIWWRTLCRGSACRCVTCRPAMECLHAHAHGK